MSAPVFQHAILIGKPEAAGVGRTLEEIASWLAASGVEPLIELETAQRCELPGHRAVALRDIGHDEARSLVGIVVGGDGTMLGAARQLSPSGVPLMGINAGRLGFITDIVEARWREALGAMLQGHFEREQRAVLAGRVQRDGETIFTGIAINDIVVNRSGATGLVELRVDVDGCAMYAQRADGLIVATPTGSTAYALSGGGSILHPSVDAVILVPICPHALGDRPIVVKGDSKIEIMINDTHGGSAQVSSDGQHTQLLTANDRVQVQRSATSVTLIHPHGHDYYRILRTKLHWGRPPHHAGKD